jgi:hypothetical protein
MPRSDARETAANDANSACGRGRERLKPRSARVTIQQPATRYRTAIGTVRFRAVPLPPKENAGLPLVGGQADRASQCAVDADDQRADTALDAHASTGLGQRVLEVHQHSSSSRALRHGTRYVRFQTSGRRRGKAWGLGQKGASVRGTNASCGASLWTNAGLTVG